jgi:hypothetical protein
MSSVTIDAGRSTRGGQHGPVEPAAPRAARPAGRLRLDGHELQHLGVD